MKMTLEVEEHKVGLIKAILERLAFVSITELEGEESKESEALGD